MSHTETWGFHTILFNSEIGFNWNGDFYDVELPAETVIIEQVLTNAFQMMSYVNVVFTEAPHLNGVRIYRMDWNRSPGVEFLNRLDIGGKIVDMGKDGHSSLLFSDDGKVHIYLPAPLNPDLLLEFHYDLPTYLGSVKRAVVLTRDIFLLEEGTDNESKLSMLLASSPGYQSYDVPSAPTIDALGDRHKCFCWYIERKSECGLNAWLVVTGTDEWLRIYFHPGIGREFKLLKYKSPDGEFNDKYTFPNKTYDWDVQLKDDQGFASLYLIAADGPGGILLGTLDLMFDQPEQYYFKVRSHQSSAGQYISCIRWAGPLYPHTYLINPRFEISRDGILGYKASRM